MNLFAYGTLMFPEVWRLVVCPIDVARDFKTTPATLPGFEILRVDGEVYPGIIKSGHEPSAITHRPLDFPLTSDLRPLTSSSVPGLVYHDVDPASLARLDDFEGDFYVRQAVTVTTDTGDQLPANAYVVPPEAAHLLTDEIWTPAEFTTRGHLADFVARYTGFHRLT